MHVVYKDANRPKYQGKGDTKIREFYKIQFSTVPRHSKLFREFHNTVEHSKLLEYPDGL